MKRKDMTGEYVHWLVWFLEGELQINSVINCSLFRILLFPRKVGRCVPNLPFPSSPSRDASWLKGDAEGRGAFDLLDGVFHGLVDFFEVFVGVAGRHRCADQVLAGRHGGRNGHDREDALLKQRLPEAVSFFLFAHDDRHGWRFAVPNVEAQAAEHFLVAAGVVPQALMMLRLSLENIDRGRCGVGLGGADGGGKNRLLAVRAQVFDDVA